jgi:type I restriction enzyme S subunit
MTNWKEYKLGEIAQIKNGKSRPKVKGDIPVYGGNGILDYSEFSNVKGETIIIGRVGAYCGSVYFENKEIWVSDNALYAKPKKGFNSKYLYYLLKEDNLNQYAGGSSHPLLTQGRLNDLKFNLPDLPTQTAIAEILSSLDDKIELNNLINQELENLAQNLFKQWFIDFEFPANLEMIP